MRRIVLLTAITLGAFPAAAQLQYVKAPVTIENVVLVQPGVSTDQGVSVPFPASEVIDLTAHGECEQTPGLLQVNINQNVIEVALSAAAVSSSGGSGSGVCPVNPSLNFDVVIDVPTLGLGPASFVYLVAEANGSFDSLSGVIGSGDAGASLELFTNGRGSSTQVPGHFSVPFEDQRYRWLPPASSPVLEDSQFGTRVMTMFPGDTVRVPVGVRLDMRSMPGSPTVGTISVQLEFRTRFPVPEPSASLSLPLGVAWLAGLSMMRGGA